MRYLSKKRLAALTLAITASIASVGFAAEEQLDEFAGEEYVVTATKTKLEAKEVPQAVEVVTQEKIKDLGAYSVQDALRLAANVDVQDNGMTGNQVMLRGSSTMHTLILVDGKRLAQENTSSSMNAYELKRINIGDVERIEIIRGNGSALYGSDAMGGVINIITKKATEPSMSINMHTGSKDEATSFNYASGKQGKVSVKIGGSIEKIRKIDSGVYKSYSTNSSTGVTTITDASGTNMYGVRRNLNTDINYEFDKNHALDFTMNFMREQLTSYSWNSMGTDYTETKMTTLGDYLATKVPAMKNQFDTVLAKLNKIPAMGQTAEVKKQIQQLTVMSKALAGITTGSELKAAYQKNPIVNNLFKDDVPTVKDFDTSMPDPSTIYKYPRRAIYHYDNNRSDYALTYNGKDGKHDYMFRTYYSQLRKDNDTWYKNLNTNTLKFVDAERNNYKQFVVEGKDTYKMDAKNTLTFGAEYKKDSMEGTYLADQTSGADSGKQSSDTAAVYVQDELKINDRLLLIPALRIDHHDSFGTHVSPKIGATYKLSDNARVKANWGKGYRAPTLYELYAHMEKVGMAPMPVNVIGNPDLDPEKSTNYDISFEAEKGKTTGKVSYYHNDISNMIDSGDYDKAKLAQNIIWTQYINRNKVEISGFEAEIGYNFDKHWSLKGSYNYIDAKDKDSGERLLYRARHNGIIQLTYTDAKKYPWTVDLYNHYYVNYHQSNEAGYQQDYTFSTTGLIVTKQLNANCNIYAGVDNIFNKEFTYDTYHTYSLDGRTWRVGAEWKF